MAAPGAGAQELPPLDAMLAERVLGAADAPVTMIEYASMTCPHCANFAAGTMPTIRTEYIDTGKVKLIFREFPTSPVELSVAAAMIARCAPPQRYFAVVDIYFKTQEKWVESPRPIEALSAVGRLAGLTEDLVDKCLQSQELYRGVVGVATRGEREFGVESTPTFIIADTKVEGDLSPDEFRKILDNALADAK